jgi:hypothetical protein
MPRWVDTATVKVAVDGAQAAPRYEGEYLALSGLRRSAEICYRCPERSTCEELPNGDVYTFVWQGDRIVGVRPNDVPRPFYPTAEQQG